MTSSHLDADRPSRQPATTPSAHRSAVEAGRAHDLGMPGTWQHALDQSPRMRLQRRAIHEAFGDAIHRPTEGVQHGTPVQRRPAGAAGPSAASANETGLPDALKAGIEALSGTDMSAVRVHRNSDKPAQLNALAYAQGHDIHLGPGQEAHLPHEAWHVVQQAQGRVRPTVQMAGVAVNDDKALEAEADLMGAKALAQRRPTGAGTGPAAAQTGTTGQQGSAASPGTVLQGMFYEWNPDGESEETQHIWHYGPVMEAWWKPRPAADGGQAHYRSYGVWERRVNLEQVHEGLQRLFAAHEQVTAATAEVNAGLSLIQEQVGTRDEIVANLEQARVSSEAYVAALGEALKTYALATLVAVPLVVGAAAVAEHFLSLPAVPMAVKAAIDVAGLLYGGFVTHRWMQTDVLPVLARAALAGGNTVIWASTIHGLLAEGLNGQWFSTVHVAALPLAMTLEYVLRRILQRVERMASRDQREGRPDYHSIV